MTVPVRRLPLANPSEEKRKARPPARRCAPRQLRPHLRFGQLPRAPCHSHPMTAQFPGLQFCCVNHGKGNEASPAPTWRASCRHLSQRPCCPTAEPFLAFFSSQPDDLTAFRSRTVHLACVELQLEQLQVLTHQHIIS